MSRLEYLLDKLEARYPNDQWMKDFRLFQSDDVFLPKVQVYEESLEVLDHESWAVFEPKLLQSFNSNIKRRGKQTFFNHLNEAIAYKFLSDKVSEVRLIPESKAKTPDISFGKENIHYCEVKTISESILQLDQYESDDLVDDEAYRTLGEPFFNKLKSTISGAVSQFPVKKDTNIVFLIVHFDDFSNMYFETYKEQILNFFKKNYSDLTIHLRSNIFDRHSINFGKLPNNLMQPTVKASAD